MNDKPMPAGIGEIVDHEGCIAQWRADADTIIRLTTALQLIASYAGKTLIGDGRYDEGANHAFEQLAAIAQAAISPD